MPQNSTHDFKEKYPYIRKGTPQLMLIKDILTKNRCLLYAIFLEYK